MKISKEALEDAAEQINSSGRVPGIGLEHDITLMPLGKVVRATVAPLGDGEYALLIEQDIFEAAEELRLSDGSVLIMECSALDSRPFATNVVTEEEDIRIGYDPNNFASEDDIQCFFVSIGEGVPFQTETIVRKSLIPDPEVLMTIPLWACVLLMGARIFEKTLDKVSGSVSEDLAGLYNSIKGAVTGAARYCIPNNRHITYVFHLPGKYLVELVARTNDADLICQALSPGRLLAVQTRCVDLTQMFNLDKAQFILDGDGQWKLSFFLTKDGKSVGSVESYSKKAEMMKTFISEHTASEGGRASISLHGSGVEEK